MDASPYHDAVSKKSLPVLRVDACSRTDASLEDNEETLKLLENSATTGDMPTLCHTLQLLRKQYGQRNRRKNWNSDMLRRLWSHAVELLHDGALPEVEAKACQLIEILAQNCKSCTEGEGEKVIHQDAPKRVIRAMELHPSDLFLQSSCIRALLSMSGCMTCHCFYDKETQDWMGKSNAISALVHEMHVLLQLTTQMQFETNAHKLTRTAIGDTVQALHYICLMNPENLQKLASLHELKIIRTTIEDDLNELTVQEHGSMLLSELVTSAVLMDQEILEGIDTIMNVARLQMQEKFIEVARAAVWSLARIASKVLRPYVPENAFGSNILGQTSPIMQGAALDIILEMMQMCQIKNDPLIKHCLDFIAVVGNKESQSPNPTTQEKLKKARVLVVDLFLNTDDMRIKAVSMRTLCVLMSNPHGIQADDGELSLDSLLHAMRGTRVSNEASSKDIFCIQVFGLANLSPFSRSKTIQKTDLCSQYIQDVHEAIEYILRYIDEGGESFFFDNSEACPKGIEVSCCRFACHCSFIHESCSMEDITASVVAAAKFLSLCGTNHVNSIDAQGRTILHKLAQSGQKTYLAAFIDACGEELDFLKLTPEGRNALDLANVSLDPSCGSLLDEATNKAAKNNKQDLKFGDVEEGKLRGKNARGVPCNAVQMIQLPFQSQQSAKYEKELEERRKQLEEMKATVKLHDRVRMCDLHTMNSSSSFFGEETDGLPHSLSGDRSLNVSVSPEPRRFRSGLLGTSLSVGSGNNNGSPDPTRAPAGPQDDIMIHHQPSAFQKHAAPHWNGSLGMEDPAKRNWRTLEPESHELLQGGNGKWIMSTSSSLQNNHIPDESRQGPILQSNWPSMTRPTQSGTSFGAQPVSQGISEEDGVDENQLMSWLSSEITGLIENQPTEPMLQLPQPTEFSHFVPPPPPQTAPPYEELGFVTDSSLSPFCAGNPMMASPYMHPQGTNPPPPWGPPHVPMDPRLIPHSELCNNAQARSAVHPSRFLHTEENDIPSKHLWLGNLNTRLPRSVLKSVFEEFGTIEDVVTFPGRMYAFVNFINPEDAQRAAKKLDNMVLPVLTGNRKLVIKFRPNRKALGRVGDLMPGVASIEDGNGGQMASSISVPIIRSPDLSGSQHSGGDNGSRLQFDEDREDGETEGNTMVVPCRHLWLGNVCVRPSKTGLFSLFSRYGPVESVRIFPGKTFAFVNFRAGEHACRAKEALDGKVLPAVTGSKALVVRFQKEGAGPAGWTKGQDTNSIPPLQSVESAPGAYANGGALISPGRGCFASPGEYPMGAEMHRQSSLSPDDFPPLRSTRMAPESMPYDLYATERSLHMDGEGVWTESLAQDIGRSGYRSAGLFPSESMGMVHTSAQEATSIGHLSRTLSAATFGNQSTSVGYLRGLSFERDTWTSAMNEGVRNDGEFASVYGALNSSHSFGGYDGKPYPSPFFVPQVTPNRPSGLSSSHSWVHPMSLPHPNAATTGLKFEQRMIPPASVTPSQAIQRIQERKEETGVQLSLPPELFIASGSMTRAIPEIEAQRDASGFVPSTVISCDKGSIW